MYKENRSATEEVYVVGFVPSHMLPKKRPNALDPFLEPLISEIENIFIDGIDLFYNIATYKICVNIHALPQRFIGSSHGSGSQTATFLKESKKPNWNFEGVGASSNKNPSVGVWIFSRNTM